MYKITGHATRRGAKIAIVRGWETVVKIDPDVVNRRYHGDLLRNFTGGNTVREIFHVSYISVSRSVLPRHRNLHAQNPSPHIHNTEGGEGASA